MQCLTHIGYDMWENNITPPPKIVELYNFTYITALNQQSQINTVEINSNSRQDKKL